MLVLVALSALAFGLAFALAGCADPIRQGATVTLRTATATVQTFEQWDHQHKRDLAGAVVKACAGTAVGGERDECVERQSAPLREYISTRRPVIDALDGMEVSAGLVYALVDLDGPAPPELAALAQKLGDTVAKALALVDQLRNAGGGR